MPAPRKYDQESRDRAVRMYVDRRQVMPGESRLEARRRVGELLDVSPDTLRGWIERKEIDAGERPGVPSAAEARMKELERENFELRRANEILKTASAFFRGGGARPQTSLIVAYIDRFKNVSGSSRYAECSTCTGCLSPRAPTMPAERRGSFPPPTTTTRAWLTGCMTCG